MRVPMGEQLDPTQRQDLLELVGRNWDVFLEEPAGTAPDNHGAQEKASPLTDMTRSRLPDKVVWTAETEKAFQALKGALCSGPMLVTPDFTKPLVVQSDASETGCTMAKARPEGRAAQISFATSYPLEVVIMDHLALGHPRGPLYALVPTDPFSIYGWAVAVRD
ncbi:hypothetical protein AAFF_G00210770 [Aldrovandia affinis]|uniref:Reverse transcriptase/retrotransposon-derived protein RNase H-like domain-containing protein n=1 Tax=Aldrovandia affinis TaxID=143900 RepID=A0AAD7WUJ8_9TELE|nr:hypothetical protein AAFF_G00210770 [Aldrovandia affinis]